MVAKLELLLALCALVAASPIPNDGDGLLNGVLDLNVGDDNQNESSHTKGILRRNGGDGLLNDLIG